MRCHASLSGSDASTGYILHQGLLFLLAGLIGTFMIRLAWCCTDNSQDQGGAGRAVSSALILQFNDLAVEFATQQLVGIETDGTILVHIEQTPLLLRQN